VKTIAELHVDLTRLGVMGSSESLAVVQQEAPIGQVQLPDLSLAL
jgi:hypothetical protein